jgi:hypothetical protein
LDGLILDFQPLLAKTLLNGLEFELLAINTSIQKADATPDYGTENQLTLMLD